MGISAACFFGGSLLMLMVFVVCSTSDYPSEGDL